MNHKEIGELVRLRSDLTVFECAAPFMLLRSAQDLG